MYFILEPCLLIIILNNLLFVLLNRLKFGFKITDTNVNDRPKRKPWPSKTNRIRWFVQKKPPINSVIYLIVIIRMFFVWSNSQQVPRVA